MNRKEFTKNLISQFEQNIGKLSDEILSEIESGDLVISLVPKLAEAGGATAIGYALIATKIAMVASGIGKGSTPG
jgi:hypothetical protein